MRELTFFHVPFLGWGELVNLRCDEGDRHLEEDVCLVIVHVHMLVCKVRFKGSPNHVSVASIRFTYRTRYHIERFLVSIDDMIPEIGFVHIALVTVYERTIEFDKAGGVHAK